MMQRTIAPKSTPEASSTSAELIPLMVLDLEAIPEEPDPNSQRSIKQKKNREAQLKCRKKKEAEKKMLNKRVEELKVMNENLLSENSQLNKALSKQIDTSKQFNELNAKFRERTEELERMGREVDKWKAKADHCNELNARISNLTTELEFTKRKDERLMEKYDNCDELPKLTEEELLDEILKAYGAILKIENKNKHPMAENLMSAKEMPKDRLSQCFLILIEKVEEYKKENAVLSKHLEEKNNFFQELELAMQQDDPSDGMDCND